MDGKKCSKPPTRYWLYWTRLKRQDLQFASRVVSGRSGRLRWWDDSEHSVANYPRLVVVGYNHSDWCGLSYNQLLVITFTCCVGYNHSYKWTTQLLTRSLSHVNHWGYNPLTSRGMSHQVGFCQSHPTIFAAKDDYEKANPTWMWRKTYRCEDRFMTPNIRPTKSLEMLVLGCWCPRKEDLMRTWWVVVYVSRRKWENHRWGFECY